MPSLSERSRNNIRAGVFVTIALIVSMVVIVAVTDVFSAIGRSSTSYIVAFDVASGVSNLKAGSDVRVGGVSFGKVTDVEPIFDGNAMRQIEVQFSLDDRIKLHDDAAIIVTAPMIGTEAWLDIPNVGDPAKPLAPGATITGVPSVGLLSSLLGPANADKTSEIVDNTLEFSSFLAKVEGEWNTHGVPMLKNAGEVMADLRQTRWPSWAQTVDNIMKWAETATVNLDGMFATGKQVLDETHGVVSENREPIKNIVANVESTTGRINSETIEKVHRFLDTGQEGLDEATAVVQAFRMDYTKWGTNLDDTFADLTLTAQQLKMASTELRRSPWKLIYRPTPDELEHELLYEATRSFAVAAADLKATSESVRRILANHGDQLGENEALYRRLEQQLQESLDRYQTAQQDMLDVLISDRNR